MEKGAKGAERKTKVVVVMGATGTGKSRLAIDLAAHFSVEVINADAMQTYRGLDVLTNKVPLHERRGVPHHLLGSVEKDVDFTSRNFRTLAIDVIDDISSRGCLPVIVGGTNYYIQALVSPFLVDDVLEDMAECSLSEGGSSSQITPDIVDSNATAAFDRLKEIDPVAANRIHPNDHRKVHRYLSLYESSGLIPSSLFQGKSFERWGRADNFRYDCCFIWLDASLSELDKYVGERVDSMMKSGLLDEVYDIYDPNADYTRGLKQAIGVREFQKMFQSLFPRPENDYPQRAGLFQILRDSDDNSLHNLFNEAVEELKANTRRLVRRQRRRLGRLEKDFGWRFHYIDATEAFESGSEHSWQRAVIEPSAVIVNAFLSQELGFSSDSSRQQTLVSRDLWSTFVCEPCGNRVLRGAHEWEQHTRGRSHRKRVYSSRKRATSIRYGETAVSGS